MLRCPVCDNTALGIGQGDSGTLIAQCSRCAAVGGLLLDFGASMAFWFAAWEAIDATGDNTAWVSSETVDRLVVV